MAAIVASPPGGTCVPAGESLRAHPASDRRMPPLPGACREGGLAGGPLCGCRARDTSAIPDSVEIGACLATPHHGGGSWGPCACTAAQQPRCDARRLAGRRVGYPLSTPEAAFGGCGSRRHHAARPTSLQLPPPGGPAQLQIAHAWPAWAGRGAALCLRGDGCGDGVPGVAGGGQSGNPGGRQGIRPGVT